MNHFFHSFILFTALSFFSSQATALKYCANDHVCYDEVPGAICADGTTTGYSYTHRKDAKHLLIHLEGGGACWTKKTCRAGTATNLSAHPVKEGPYFSQPKKKQRGWWNLRNPHNPIAKNFNLVHIPYCTGDAFTGNRTVNYGTPAKPYTIHHYGFKNLNLILDKIRTRFPNPQKVLFYGESAGGLGVTWNLKQVRETYPLASMYVINDGGLPFKPPYVEAHKIEAIYKTWGADETLPIESWRDDLSAITTETILYNQKHFPEVRYGFISSHKDVTMTFFSKLLKAPQFVYTVRRTMRSLANNEFAQSNNYRVFYLRDWWHVYFKKDPYRITSMGKRLSVWAKEMLNDSYHWYDIRPVFH